VCDSEGERGKKFGPLPQTMQMFLKPFYFSNFEEKYLKKPSSPGSYAACTIKLHSAVAHFC
jgi:hypothetical protein